MTYVLVVVVGTLVSGDLRRVVPRSFAALPRAVWGVRSAPVRYVHKSCSWCWAVGEVEAPPYCMYTLGHKGGGACVHVVPPACCYVLLDPLPVVRAENH